VSFLNFILSIATVKSLWLGVFFLVLAFWLFCRMLLIVDVVRFPDSSQRFVCK
jgi:hypothetical protein